MIDRYEELPGDPPLPRAAVHAVGLIALNFCQLENILKAVFSAVTRLNRYQTAALFHRLSNDIRDQVISELLAKSTIPNELRSLIDYFLEGYGVCADNRNFVMHSASGGTHRGGIEGASLVLQRHSRAGNKLECYPTVIELRAIAEEIHGYMGFGAWVASDASGYAAHLRRGEPESTFRASPATLRDKPPPPHALRWQIPDDPKASGLPPEALELLSPHRVRDDP